jgi:hypothetical protein
LFIRLLFIYLFIHLIDFFFFFFFGRYANGTDGWTGHDEVIIYLLNRGVDINLVNLWGATGNNNELFCLSFFFFHSYVFSICDFFFFCLAEHDAPARLKEYFAKWKKDPHLQACKFSKYLHSFSFFFFQSKFLN